MIRLELAVIALPVLLVLSVIGLPSTTLQPLKSCDTGKLIIMLMVIGAVVSTGAVWFLSIRFLRGARLFAPRYALALLFVLVGFMELALVPIAFYLNNPQPYSDGWQFHDQLGTLILGVPLALPAVHVCLAPASQRMRL